MIFPYMITPWLPTNNDKPPTIYSILNSIVNFNNPNPVKITDLPKNARTTIFDFDYPLSDKVDKEQFECMILKKFMMRRIGFDTPTAFKIQLEVKLNEIMPYYNILFDAIDNWNLFNDGEITTRTINGSNTLNNTSNNISDRRYSSLPQNEISDVQNGNYMTDYNYDTDNVTSNSTGSNTSTETVTSSPSDKIKNYREFMENRNKIMSMIYNDLNDLFYGLI